MRYVIAGYVFVLCSLALYSVQLLWRRRRLAEAVDRAAISSPATSSPAISSPAISSPVSEVVP